MRTAQETLRQTTKVESKEIVDWMFPRSRTTDTEVKDVEKRIVKLRVYKAVRVALGKRLVFRPYNVLRARLVYR